MISQLTKLPGIGRFLFVFGLMVIGVEHFIFQEFVVGRAPPWPDGIPGRIVWAYFSGLFFIIACMLMLLGIKVRMAAVSGACLIFAWAFIRQLPVLYSEPFLSGAWTQAGKALVFTGGLLAVAVRDVGFTKIARFCLGIFMLITGVQHFLFVEFVASLIPPWFPGNSVFWTYFAGVALISGGIGLVIPKTSRLSALLSGVMIFSWVWIVHFPRFTAGMSDQISVFETLAFSGLAFFLVQSFVDNRL